jgi:hypothetical protein
MKNKKKRSKRQVKNIYDVFTNRTALIVFGLLVFIFVCAIKLNSYEFLQAIKYCTGANFCWRKNNLN